MKKIIFSSVGVTVAVAIVLYLYHSLPNVFQLRKQNPRSTALMELRDEQYRQKGMRHERRQIWVAYGAISEHLKKAVLISEDASFFSHKGVDLQELKKAIKTDLETWSFRRGGSTITMQLAKNLYLSPSKNPLRKLKEIIIAWQLEHALSKRRIFEIYLNVVEFGRHIYGVEAAARHYFNKSANALNPLEAATLAALLPNPLGAQERNLLRRRNLILARLQTIGHIDQEERNRFQQTPLFSRVDLEAPFLPQPE